MATLNEIDELFLAVRNGEYDKAKRVLDQIETADVRDVISGLTPLHHAAASGDIEMLKLLMRYGANVNSSSNDSSSSPLGTAAVAGNRAAVEFLLRCGARLEECEAGIVEEAIEAGDFEIAELLRTIV